MARVTLLGATSRGLAAGAIGTAVMTAWQELSTKLQRSVENRGREGQVQPGAREPDPWEQASAPAKAARKTLKGVFGYEVPAEKIGLLTNATHWGYGTGWGALYGLIQDSAEGPALRRGLLFGTAVWATSYLTLVPMGIYQPPWKYQPNELALDLSYHLAYGVGVGEGYALVDR